MPLQFAARKNKHIHFRKSIKLIKGPFLLLHQTGPQDSLAYTTELLVENLVSFLESSGGLIGNGKEAKLTFHPSDGYCTISQQGNLFTLDSVGQKVCVKAAFVQAKPLSSSCIEKLKMWKVGVEWNCASQAGISKEFDASLLAQPEFLCRRVDGFVVSTNMLAEKQRERRMINFRED